MGGLGVVDGNALTEFQVLLARDALDDSGKDGGNVVPSFASGTYYVVSRRGAAFLSESFFITEKLVQVYLPIRVLCCQVHSAA